ncbi:MAG TPA: ABC transporter permease, partial [Nitrospira sp.]|nr:ABC transporter permease [Nitrospira sp.]
MSRASHRRVRGALTINPIHPTSHVRERCHHRGNYYGGRLPPEQLPPEWGADRHYGDEPDMSFLWLTIFSALRVLRRNPLRAGLTMLGIIIGVGAVVGMVSLGQGATASVQREIASLGTNVLIIIPG